MSMLTQGLDRPFDPAERPALISPEHRARLKGLARVALALLSMGSVLTALIALRTTIYVWHLLP
jgi:hypothetical protein